MKDLDALSRELHRIDGRGYKAYKDIQGGYRLDGGAVFVDHVQADPFAAPSKLRIRCDQGRANLPPELHRSRTRRIALEDYLTRRVHRAIKRVVKQRGDRDQRGIIAVDVGGQEVLQRTSVVVTEDWVEARIEVGLPAAGRKIMGRQAAAMLCEELPEIIERSLVWTDGLDKPGRRFVQCVENQQHIADQLEQGGLIAFVADDAVLPRKSGVSDEPMPAERVVPFRSPEGLRVTMEVPNPIDGPDGETQTLHGMGVPKGVTLIVGGGYHGKSTLLRALECGVYRHVPDDGREYVVTNPDAVKVRAEDRRRIDHVTLTPFIEGLPDGTDTDAFCTGEASGSTSQAAAIVESVEAGAAALLMDEDTCATNLMVRDARMQALVAKDSEPITPLLERVRELSDRLGISGVLVMGGCGDYFDVADRVLMMRHYRPYEVTDEARRIAQERPTQRRDELGDGSPLELTERAVDPKSVDPSRGRKPVKIDAPTRESLRFGRTDVDLRCLDQLVDISQTRAVGNAIHLAADRFMAGDVPLREVLDRIDALLDEEGLDVLSPFVGGKGGDRPHPGRFARPRRHEIAAAINRMRSVRMRQLQPAAVAR